MFTCQISSPSVYSVALWWHKKLDFAVFWTSAFCGFAIWQYTEKVECRCTTTTFLYPMVSTSFLYWTALWRHIVHTISVVQKRDKHKPTHRQTKNSTFRRHGGGWNPSPSKLDMVIEDLEHVLAPLKRLGVWHIVLTQSFTARGRWKFGGNPKPLIWNPHNSVTLQRFHSNFNI